MACKSAGPTGASNEVPMGSLPSEAMSGTSPRYALKPFKNIGRCEWELSQIVYE